MESKGKNQNRNITKNYTCFASVRRKILKLVIYCKIQNMYMIKN